MYISMSAALNEAERNLFVENDFPLFLRPFPPALITFHPTFKFGGEN